MADEVDRAELEDIVCKYIRNKRLSKEQLTSIYLILQREIYNNNIPSSEYWRTENKFTFDFSIQLTNVSIEALIGILDVAGFGKN